MGRLHFLCAAIQATNRKARTAATVSLRFMFYNFYGFTFPPLYSELCTALHLALTLLQLFLTPMTLFQDTCRTGDGSQLLYFQPPFLTTLIPVCALRSKIPNAYFSRLVFCPFPLFPAQCMLPFTSSFDFSSGLWLLFLCIPFLHRVDSGFRACLIQPMYLLSEFLPFPSPWSLI